MNKSKKRILMVDDEPNIIQLLKEAIEYLDKYHVVAAYNGEMAMKLFHSKGPFDLLITDLNMPGMNGEELSLRIRAVHHGMKIILLTADSDYQDDSINFNAVVTQSTDIIDVLLPTIDRLLEKEP